MNNWISIDFETYSEAGYYFDGTLWRSVSKSPPHGLGAVGAAVYSEHPSTRVLFLAYGPRIWTPDSPPPLDLFRHVQSGGAIRAFNAEFEFYIWNNVCVKRYGFPPLRLAQIVDTMGECTAFGIPGKLSKAGEALGLGAVKMDAGKRLIQRYSKPNIPSKRFPTGIPDIKSNLVDYALFASYNLQDVIAEESIAARIPQLTATERAAHALHHEINTRGVYIDKEGLDHLQGIVEAEKVRLNTRLREITGGFVPSGDALFPYKDWLRGRGWPMPKLTKDAIREALGAPLVPPDVREALEIRLALGSTSVTKLAAIERRLCADNRIRGLFAFCGATVTGRFAGRGPQPQNLPAGGLPLTAVEAILAGAPVTVAQYSNPLETVSSCLRGLFCAAPGHILVCSDFSAIEAVVLAELSGEEWRREVFRTHGKIYEMSASKISGIPLEEILAHKERTGEHHPLRKKLGKIAELGSGYSGWIGAWKNFGADKFFDDDQQIKEAILKWRAESPRIVEFWGGQVDKTTGDYRRYGLEGAFINAVQNPLVQQTVGLINYLYNPYTDILFGGLPSGRCLFYHKPRLSASIDKFTGAPIYRLSYMGYNSDSTKGKIGWVRINTYGGKLVENVTQATARDILVNSMLALNDAGYKIVLHVHDEIVAEMPEGKDYVKGFEKIMSGMPQWARGWPVRAVGGWQGRRYRKD